VAEEVPYFEEIFYSEKAVKLGIKGPNAEGSKDASESGHIAAGTV
jgi:hypothetical protein